MFIGLDIGTSALKAILIDERQKVLADASADYPTERPAPGLSEQDPDAWIAGGRKALAALRNTAPAAFAAVRAIGLSGQMHSPVLLGGNLRPIGRSLLWNDPRGQAECAALSAALPNIGTVTGVLPMAGFTAAKLAWMRKHRAEAFGRIAHLLLPKDYVRLWLTGGLASDVSDGAGTQLLDEAKRTWWPEILATLALPPEIMPPLFEGTAVTGTVRGAVAAELGLGAGVLVAAGGGDSATGALGVGCIQPGEGYISLGTGAVFAVTSDRYAPKPETLLHTFAHCLPGRWYQMAGMLNGASALGWWLAALGEGDAETALKRVAAGYRGPVDVTFLPYLAGERTPHNDPQARGAFAGIGAGTTRDDLIQAVLEGIAFSLRDARDCLIAADADCPEPGFTGGGARNRFWAQVIANVTGLRLKRYRGAELGPALGAARLAMIAAGAGSPEAICTPPIAETIEPDARLADAYAERFADYRALYPATRRAGPPG